MQAKLDETLHIEIVVDRCAPEDSRGIDFWSARPQRALGARGSATFLAG